MMDDLRNHGLVVLAMQQCCDIIFSSSSDESDDDTIYEYAVQLISNKNAIPRLQNYVKAVVPLFNDGQFKSHIK